MTNNKKVCARCHLELSQGSQRDPALKALLCPACTSYAYGTVDYEPGIMQDRRELDEIIQEGLDHGDR